MLDSLPACAETVRWRTFILKTSTFSQDYFSSIQLDKEFSVPQMLFKQGSRYIRNFMPLTIRCFQMDIVLLHHQPLTHSEETRTKQNIWLIFILLGMEKHERNTKCWAALRIGHACKLTQTTIHTTQIQLLRRAKRYRNRLLGQVFPGNPWIVSRWSHGKRCPPQSCNAWSSPLFFQLRICQKTIHRKATQKQKLSSIG